MTLLGVLQVPSSPRASAGHQPLVLGVKMEYLEEFGLEMFQPAELARWQASLQLQPTCNLLVGPYSDKHANIPDCRCMVNNRSQNVHSLTYANLYCTAI